MTLNLGQFCPTHFIQIDCIKTLNHTITFDRFLLRFQSSLSGQRILRQKELLTGRGVGYMCDELPYPIGGIRVINCLKIFLTSSGDGRAIFATDQWDQMFPNIILLEYFRCVIKRPWQSNKRDGNYYKSTAQFGATNYK